MLHFCLQTTVQKSFHAKNGGWFIRSSAGSLLEGCKTSQKGKGSALEGLLDACWLTMEDVFDKFSLPWAQKAMFEHHLLDLD